MSLCRHCNAIDLSKCASLSKAPNNTHHRTFRELKQSAQSCPLCALFVEGLEKYDWGFDYDRTWEAGDATGLYYNGEFEDSDQNGVPKTLVGLSMKCQGCNTTLDVYASEGQLESCSLSSPLLRNSGSKIV